VLYRPLVADIFGGGALEVWVLTDDPEECGLPRGHDVRQSKAQDISVELDGPVKGGHR
jgi:hypothetical protein